MSVSLLRRARGAARPLLLALALAASLGCGSSSPTRPPPPTMSVRFEPRASPPPPNSVTLQAAARTATTLTLDVVATQVTNVASVFFDVVFNPGIVRCTGATVGPFLGSSGATVTFVLPPDVAAACEAGRLPVGITITPATTGVTGTGVVCSVHFASVATGSSFISFELAGARGPLAVPIPGVTFTGGDVFVQR